MDTLVLYSRGFMGSRMNGVEIAPFRKKRLHVLSLFDLKKEEIEKVVINDGVTAAYERMIRKDVNAGDFDFREVVIRQALRAFGTQNFSTWLLANLRSPALSQQHADFISDTIGFVKTGKRQFPVAMWERMITAGSNDPTKPSEYSREAYANMDCSSQVDLLRSNSRTLSFVQEWVARPGGFADMVYSLNILFGEDRN